MLLRRTLLVQQRALATKAKRKAPAAVAAAANTDVILSNTAQEGSHMDASGIQPVLKEEESKTAASVKKVEKTLAKPKSLSSVNTGSLSPSEVALAQLKQQQKDALAIALGKIDKQFGKGTVSQLGSQPAYDTSRVISTGALSLDDALGSGGLPQGRIVEIFGPEASGKTCRLLKNIPRCHTIDRELTFSLLYSVRFVFACCNLAKRLFGMKQQKLKIV